MNRTRPAISVVIPCFAEERFEDVLEGVDALRRQTLPPAEIVIVVDHNPALLGRLRRSLGGIKVIASRECRGSSGARNTGIASTRGEIIVFFDDDATAEPDCLERLLGHYADETVLGVGGGLSPEWCNGRPRWFPEEFNWVVGCSYRGLPSRPTPQRNLLGAAMSFRRGALEAVGGFSAEMARTGRHPLGVDDTEVCIRIRREFPGSVLLYAPDARARHKVPATRARRRYFCTRCFAEGRAKAALTTVSGWGESLSSERAYLVRVLPVGVLREVLSALTGKDSAGLQRSLAIVVGLFLTTAGYVAGTIQGSWGRAVRTQRRAGPEVRVSERTLS
jgi:GT2 family glycosyltransferase